jgi:hypothetical protein
MSSHVDEQGRQQGEDERFIMMTNPRNTKIATCPAIIFANNRMQSANGFAKSEISSIGTMISNSGAGNPPGIRLRKYPTKPLFAIPAP